VFPSASTFPAPAPAWRQPGVWELSEAVREGLVARVAPQVLEEAPPAPGGSCSFQSLRRRPWRRYRTRIAKAPVPSRLAPAGPSRAQGPAGLAAVVRKAAGPRALPESRRETQSGTAPRTMWGSKALELEALAWEEPGWARP
jgi:hypothetical protein